MADRNDYQKSWTRHDIPMRWHDHLHRVIPFTQFCMWLNITANMVTVFRGLLIIPTLVLAGHGHFMNALMLYILSWWGDAIDGSIARERLRQGHEDDEDLGAFLDPMVDKGAWGITVLLCPLIVDFSLVENWVVTGGVYATITLLLIEITLGSVRVHDFRYNRKSDNGSLNLCARWPGKVKMVLEAVGLGALIAAADPLIGGAWCYHLWVWLLCAAIPLAIASLAQKLWARRQR